MRPGLPDARSKPAEPLEVLGISFLQADAAEALAAIERACDTKDGAVSIAFVNSHGLNLASADPGYRAVLQGFDFRLCDGVGVAIAAFVQRQPIPNNLNGNDFSPELLRLASRRGWPVFLLGGHPGVAKRAAGKLVRDIPGLIIAGTQHGYLPDRSSDDIADQVRASGAQLLLVCMGNPIQEQWIAERLDRTGVRLGAGVGAFFDFVTGDLRRAPKWMTLSGVEWAHRLAYEPKRLWRRYLVGIPLFIGRVVGGELRRKKPRREEHG